MMSLLQYKWLCLNFSVSLYFANDEVVVKLWLELHEAQFETPLSTSIPSFINICNKLFAFKYSVGVVKILQRDS